MSPPGDDLEEMSQTPKPKWLLKHLPAICLCKFGISQMIGSRNILQTRKNHANTSSIWTKNNTSFITSGRWTKLIVTLYTGICLSYLAVVVGDESFCRMVTLWLIWAMSWENLTRLILFGSILRFQTINHSL